MTTRAALFRAEGVVAAQAVPEDGPALEALFTDCTDFFDLTTGLPPGPAEVQSLFMAVPDGKTHFDKQVISLVDDAGTLLGVMDLVRDYPKQRVWWLGLMLLRPEQRGRGQGGRVIRSFIEWAGAAGAASIRLAVKEQNGLAYRFWRQMGFETIEALPPKRLGSKWSVAIVMQRDTH